MRKIVAMAVICLTAASGLTSAYAAQLADDEAGLRIRLKNELRRADKPSAGVLNQSIKILVNATFPTDQYLVLKPNNLMLLQKLSVMYVANCQPLTEYDKVSYHNYNPSRSDLI
mgnify:CR=1 FL=1